MRIFVSSPSDVAAERKIALQVIARLRSEFKHHFDIKPVLWEHEPLLATAHFQEGLIPPSECDVLVCVLWSTLGSPLPEQFVREDGSKGVTGTEWEFQIGRKSFFEQEKPEILVYRKTRQVQISLADGEAVDRARERLKQVDEFFDRYFHNKDKDKTFKAAYWPFDGTGEFEDLLYTHLSELLRRHVRAAGTGGDDDAITWVQGSPFRGLQSFELEHAEVFFGRSRARNDLIQQFQLQVLEGSPFLMVLGASGTGKSSLVKAGLLPLLLTPGVIPQVAETRWCVLKPSECGEDLTTGLLRVMLADSALPEMLPDGDSFDSLLTRVSNSPHALEAMIFSTLGGIKQRVGYKPELQVRMLLIIDQFEELFALPGISDTARTHFVSLLASLVASGHTWVIGTMRSDFFALCEAYPELLELMRGHGQYHLHPPAVEEVEQMIRLPTRAAGLGFERNEEGIGLDAALRQSAADEPAILPLLSFTLEELYSRRTKEGLMTWKAYQELGGIEGAITRRATETFRALPKDSQDELPALLSGVITLSSQNTDTASAKTATWSYVAENPSRERLVQAFISARLLIVADDLLDTGKSVRLAHEALLRRWSKAKDWIDRNQEFLRARARIIDSAHYWDLEGRPRPQLIPEGRLLELAVELEETYAADLDVIVLAYIHASLDERDHRSELALRQQNETRSRKRRFQMIAAAVVIVILGAVGVAWQGQRQAQRLIEIQNRNAALAAERTAARDIDYADEELAAGNIIDGVSMAVRALRDKDRLSDELLVRALSAANRGLNLRPTSYPLGAGRILTGDLLWYSDQDGSWLQDLAKRSEPVPIKATFLTPDESGLLTYQPSGELVHRSIKPFRSQRTIATGLTSWVFGLAPDQSYAFYSVDKRLHQMSLPSGETGILAMEREIDDVQPSENWMLITDIDGHITAWNGVNAVVLNRPVWNASARQVDDFQAFGPIELIAQHPQLPRLLTRDEKGVIELWDASDGQRLARVRPSRLSIEDDGVWFGDGELALHRIRWSDGWTDARLLADDFIAAFDHAGGRVVVYDRSGALGLWDSAGTELSKTQVPFKASDSAIDLVLADTGDRGFLLTESRGYRIDLSGDWLAVTPVEILNPRLDHKSVVYRDGDGIRVDRLDGSELASRINTPADSQLLALSHEGRLVATTTDRQAFQVWNTLTGQQNWQFPVEGRLESLEFEDGGRLAIATTIEGVVAWDLKTKSSSLDWHSAELIADADRWNDTVAIAQGTSISVHLITDLERPIAERDLGSRTQAVRISSDGRMLIVGTSAGQLFWLDTIDLSTRHLVKLEGPVAQLDVLTSARVLVSTQGSNMLYVWTPGDQDPELKLVHWGPISRATMNVDETLVASLTEDGAVNLWDAKSGRFVDRQVYASNAVSAIGFDGQDLKAFVNIGASRLRVQELDTGATLIELDRADLLDGVASVDSSRLSLLTVNDTIELWNTHDDSLVKRIQLTDSVLGESVIRSAALSSEDDAGSPDLAEQPGKLDHALHMFSPDGNLLIVQVSDGRVRVFDAATGELRYQLTGPGQLVGFDITNTLLISQQTEGTNRYWNLVDGQEFEPEGRPRAFNVQVNALAFEVGDRIALKRPFQENASSSDQWVNADQVLATRSNNQALVWKKTGSVELINFSNGEMLRLADELTKPPRFARFVGDQPMALIGFENRILSVRFPEGSVIESASNFLVQR